MITATEADLLLDSLRSGLDEAAGRGRRTLVGATVPVGECDPSAIAFASRMASDRWFCWEQPERDGFALAALGSSHEVVSRGPGRFDDVVASSGELIRDRIAAEPAGLPASAGPVWTGGFAFAPHGGASPHWA